MLTARGDRDDSTKTHLQIQEQLRALKKSTQDCGVEVERTRQLQETHSINFYKHHQISGKWRVTTSFFGAKIQKCIRRGCQIKAPRSRK